MTKKKKTERIRLADIKIDPYAAALLRKPEMKPYVDYHAVVMGKESKEAIMKAWKRIKNLPLDKRYLYRVSEALNWGFADFDTTTLGFDLECLSKAETKKLVGNFPNRAIQFCLLLTALYGPVQMEEMMLQAISEVKSIPVE